MYWSGERAPAAGVGLRSGSSAEYRLVDLEADRTIGTVDEARVFGAAHPGAVYLHQGQQYRVERLDLRDHVALLAPYDDDEYTQPRTETDIAIVADEKYASVGGGAVVHLGAVQVRSNVIAFQRKQISTNRVIEVCDLDLPERALVTRACWYTVPADIVEHAGIASGRLLGTVHAAEHGLIGMLPLFTICDRWDVGGVSTAWLSDTGMPTVFIHDAHEGGAGIAELAFDAAAHHVRATLDLIAACPCDDGCPSCVQSPKCGNWNEYLDKAAAVVLLEALGAVAPVPSTDRRTDAS
jgi:DEAD/DEAH box helicase domain-containing protein